MANEKRLIDANALLDKVQFRLPIDNQIAEVIAGCVDITRRLVDNAPTVDAVEVVRCKDCEYCGHFDGLLYCDNSRGLAGSVSPEGFCSYGERRTDNV